MNANRLLEVTLRDILQSVYPLEEDWTLRFHIIEELRAIVQSIDNLRGATVEPFGSFASNLFTRWGDLDISIELSNGRFISCAGKKQKESLLGEVLKALRSSGRFRNLQFIPNAKVPILKLWSDFNISCDISINNLSGQMKSKILFWINEIDGRFRDMVLLVKEWAKAHKINDPKYGTLNSYSLSMLVLFHLQTCAPAILPPLNEIYPGNMIDDLQGVRADAEKSIKETCAVNINRYRSNRARVINRSSLSELFVSFLMKYCDISTRASSQGLSTYTGQWEDIEGNMRWLPRTYALFVEDPFEQPVNTARTVSSKQLMKIEEAFQSTYNMLMTDNPNPNYIISTLVRPQVYQFVARTPIRMNGNYIRDDPRTRQYRQHVQRATPSPVLVQQQFQNIRNNNHQNSSAHRPVQPVRTKGQQVWRPRS